MLLKVIFINTTKKTNLNCKTIMPYKMSYKSCTCNYMSIIHNIFETHVNKSGFSKTLFCVIAITCANNINYFIFII